MGIGTTVGVGGGGGLLTTPLKMAAYGAGMKQENEDRLRNSLLFGALGAVPLGRKVAAAAAGRTIARSGTPQKIAKTIFDLEKTAGGRVAEGAGLGGGIYTAGQVAAGEPLDPVDLAAAMTALGLVAGAHEIPRMSRTTTQPLEAADAPRLLGTPPGTVPRGTPRLGPGAPESAIRQPGSARRPIDIAVGYPPGRGPLGSIPAQTIAPRPPFIYQGRQGVPDPVQALPKPTGQFLPPGGPESPIITTGEPGEVFHLRKGPSHRDAQSEGRPDYMPEGLKPLGEPLPHGRGEIKNLKDATPEDVASKYLDLDAQASREWTDAKADRPQTYRTKGGRPFMPPRRVLEGLGEAARKTTHQIEHLTERYRKVASPEDFTRFEEIVSRHRDIAFTEGESLTPVSAGTQRKWGVKLPQSKPKKGQYDQSVPVPKSPIGQLLAGETVLPAGEIEQASGQPAQSVPASTKSIDSPVGRFQQSGDVFAGSLFGGFQRNLEKAGRFKAPPTQAVRGSGLDMGAQNYRKSGDLRAWVDGVKRMFEPEVLPKSERPPELFVPAETPIKVQRQFKVHIPAEVRKQIQGLKDTSIWSYNLGNRSYFLGSADNGTIGPFTRGILYPNHGVDMARRQWSDAAKAEIVEWAKKWKVKPGSKRANEVGVMQETPEHAGNPMIEEGRALFNKWRELNNEIRRETGRPEIAYKEDYIPHIRKTGWQDRLRLDSGQGINRDGAPDFMKSKGVTNPRAMQRTGKLEDYKTDIIELMTDYVDITGKDIFNSPTIMNNRAYARAAKAAGLENTARQIHDYTDVVYGMKAPPVTKLMNRSHSGVRWTRDRIVGQRRRLNKSVFPYNWMWNIIVQPSSSSLTVMRYGPKKAIEGLALMHDPKFRKWALEETYASSTKRRSGGKLTTQDTGDPTTTLKFAPLEKRGLVDRFTQMGQFLAERIEQELTLHGTATAYRDGLSRGMTGRTLNEWASEGGQKTQSLYNFEDIPGVLQNKEIGALIPFQTFSFEVFNNFGEIFANRGLGKTLLDKKAGYGRDAGKGAESGMPAKTFKRARMLTGLIAMGLVWNWVGERVTGRRPWTPRAVLPFSDVFLPDPGRRFNNRGRPVPYQIIDEFWRGFDKFLKTGDITKLAKWFVRYNIVGGTTWNRMWSGVEAVESGQVPEGDEARTIIMGKSAAEKTRKFHYTDRLPYRHRIEDTERRRDEKVLQRVDERKERVPENRKRRESERRLRR